MNIFVVCLAYIDQLHAKAGTQEKWITQSMEAHKESKTSLLQQQQTLFSSHHKPALIYSHSALHRGKKGTKATTTMFTESIELQNLSSQFLPWLAALYSQTSADQTDTFCKSI